MSAISGPGAAAGPRPPLRLGPGAERWFDVALVGVLLLPALAYLFEGAREIGLLAAAQTLPLLWRRRHPVAVYATIAAAHAVQLLILDTPIYSQAALLVATYAVARFAAPRWSVGVLAVGTIGAVLAAVDWLGPLGMDGPRDFLPYAVGCTLAVVAAWALGALRAARDAHLAGLVERAERRELQARQEIALAAQRERARIAREMHDVIAHSLTTIVVQADGARFAAAADPEVATRALGTVSATAREALDETRRMLGLLREGETGTAPVPALADLRRLLDEAGPRVTATLPDPGTAVSAGAGSAAYRIVQEALSNVRKHAGPAARATVIVDVTPEEIRVAVLDDGRGAAAPDDGLGHGLTGMRERAAAHGGTVTAGPRPGGGFGVSARLPR